MTDDDDRRGQGFEAEAAVMKDALDLPGPWPASTTARTRNVEVLDVDRYEGFADVLAAIERSAHRGEPALQATVFRSDNGWRAVCGGGGGGGEDALVQRWRWRETAGVIRRRGGGRCHPLPNERRQTVCYAEVFCSRGVASVVVDRPSDRRLADVRQGPGWIAIVWPEGSEPRVTALGPTGEELDYLDPGLFRDR